jgi:hypothetical protein
MDPISIAAVSVATSKFANEVMIPRQQFLVLFHTTKEAYVMYRLLCRFSGLMGLMEFSHWLECSSSMTLRNLWLVSLTIS